MTGTSDKLPSYLQPPVVEVVTSIQFDALARLDVVRLGLLWQRFKERFPNVEQQAPLAPVIERLGIGTPTNRFQIELAHEALVPRLWFVSNHGDELIQVQNDRFIRNWRKVPRLGNSYPRYLEHVRPRFIEDFRLFQEFLLGNVGEQPVVNQCEISYINHIVPNRYWASHRDIGAVFRGWNPSFARQCDPEIEAVHVRTAHLINDDTGVFAGRLHVSFQSVFQSAGEGEAQKETPAFVASLTARGRPIGEGESGILQFLDKGRTDIVQCFDKMTTPEMHEVWGKMT